MTIDELMMKYASPANERSLAKGIPIKLLKWVQHEIANETYPTKVRYMFRGHSGGWRYNEDLDSYEWYKRPQSFCHKGMASTFAIYERPNYYQLWKEYLS